MKRLLLVTVLVGLLLFAALSTGFSLYYRLLYILALAFGGGLVWAWLNLHWLGLEVEHRVTRTQVGGTIEGRIWVRNRGRLPKAWLEVEELANLPGHYSGQVVSLGGGGFRSWRVRTVCRQRGIYDLGPLRVSSGDPFGLIHLERLLPTHQRVVVYPAIVGLPHFTLPPSDLPSDGLVRQQMQQLTPLASTVRDYLYGDSVNRIHWPSTARLGRLMTKEFDLGFSTDVWMALDLHREVQAGEPPDSTEEVAVTIAASIAKRLLDQGMAVGLVAHGDQHSMIPPARGYVQMERLLEYLAQVRAEGEAPLEQALASMEYRLNRYNALLVITPSSRAQLAHVLAKFRSRGVRPTAILLDNSSFGGTLMPAQLMEQLSNLAVPAYLVQQGVPLQEALSRPFAWAGNGVAPEIRR
ncbi:MAG: DUF58 domain-containing protein [Dehalococcoidia bacterium]